MTTRTMTLAEFLLTRYKADKAAAGSVHEAGCDFWKGVDDPRFGWECDCSVPSRVNADLVAKVRIVQLHTDVRSDRYGLVMCLSCDEDWPCRTLIALALPYVDHPDFREEWRA